MASVMAIVSKAVFEKQAGRVGAGELVAFDRYASTHKTLDILAAGGSIFMVTVRPPDEKLWLVGILEAPEKRDDGWYAEGNRTPIVDIGALKPKLRFASGTGLQAKPGTLGMSLQTPRALTAEDEALLRATTGAKKPQQKPEKKPAPAPAPAPAPVRAAAPSTPGLPALKAALDSKDSAAALRDALAWWRATRAPALADAIDRISAAVSGPPIDGADHNAWATLAAARDPMDLGRLLPAVPELPASFLPTAGELLSSFPDDPRLAAAVATWAQDPPTTSSSTYPFWTRVLEAAGRAGDSRVLPLLAKRLKAKPGDSQFWPKFYGAIERFVAKVKGVEPGEVDAGALAKLGRAIDALPSVATGERAGAQASAPDPAQAGPLLPQAAKHLDGGRISAAIDALIRHWQGSRLPQVADLVDRATRLLPSWDLPLTASKKELGDAWNHAFEDRQARAPQIYDNLLAGGPKLAETRLVALGALPDDPRLSYRLAELGGKSGVSPERTQFWRAVWELIARHRDVRVCAPLRRQYNDFTGTYYDHHRQGKRLAGAFLLTPEQAFASWPLEPAADDVKWIAKLDRALAGLEEKARSTELHLLAAMGADRDDDEPRRVYADWLGERGHPRGELLMLQLTPKKSRSAAQTARIEALLDVPRLFGPFDEIRSVDYRKNDVDLPRELASHWLTNTLAWRSAAAHPLASVVEKISFDKVQYGPLPEDFERFVAAAPRLETVTFIADDYYTDEVARHFFRNEKTLTRI